MYHARYIQKGESLPIETFQAKTREMIENRVNSTYTSAKERKALKSASDYQIDDLGRQLYGLNEALLNDRSVFAVCEKEPRNLDAGRHYFSVYYIDEKGQTNIIWGGENLYSLIGQDRQDRDRNVRRYIYSSRAIGMSRLLDATDRLFSTLKSISGTYTQIS